MRIVQQIFTDQLLKIPLSGKRLQFLIDIQLFQITPWFVFAVQPAVEQIDPVDQTFREGTVIRLPETELKVIDPRLHSLLIDSVGCDFFQCASDDSEEFFLFLLPGIFRHDGEKRLKDPVLVSAIDILADPRVQKRLFHRSARRVQKDIFQDGKSKGETHVQGISGHHIAGKIRIIFLRLVFQHRIRNSQLLRSVKRLLQRNF